MDQKLYWNKVASTKEFTTPFQFDLFTKYVCKDANILDIGCGYGRTLNELYQNGYKNIFGMDFSEKMIERGKRLYSYLNLQTMEDGKIKCSGNSFDVVILLAVLTCVIDDNDQIELLNEIKRILKPGGIIYINDFLLNNDKRNMLRYEECYTKYKTYGIFELTEGAIVRHHDKEWVVKCLEIFEELKYEEVIYTTMNGNKSNGYYYFGRKLSE
jgi:SAM-dependent methyltransferase